MVYHPDIALDYSWGDLVFVVFLLSNEMAIAFRPKDQA
jgi:hypothetical protein